VRLTCADLIKCNLIFASLHNPHHSSIASLFKCDFSYSCGATDKISTFAIAELFVIINLVGIPDICSDDVISAFSNAHVNNGAGHEIRTTEKCFLPSMFPRVLLVQYHCHVSTA